MSNDPKAQVQELRAAELRLEDDLTAAKAALIEARERESAAVLNAAIDGGKSKNAGESAAVIGERIRAIEGAITQIRPRRIDVIKAVWAAEAAGIREQATAKRAEAERHAERTVELLAAVKEHEGCDYVPGYLVSRERSFRIAQMGESITFTIPLSEAMEQEAAGIDEQAAVVERRNVTRSGQVIGSTVDEVLAAVRGWDAWQIGPTLHSVMPWLERAEKTVQAATSRMEPEQREKSKVTYTLVWTNGEIVEESSDVQLGVYQKRRDGSRYFDDWEPARRLRLLKPGNVVELNAYRDAGLTA